MMDDFIEQTEEIEGEKVQKSAHGSPPLHYVLYPFDGTFCNAGTAVDRVLKGEFAMVTLPCDENRVCVADFLAGAAYALGANVSPRSENLLCLRPPDSNCRPSC